MTHPTASGAGLRGLRTALHTLALPALVAASTAVLVAPELFTGQASVHRPLPLSMLALGHA
jgi:hypothetical protein